MNGWLKEGAAVNPGPASFPTLLSSLNVNPNLNTEWGKKNTWCIQEETKVLSDIRSLCKCGMAELLLQ